MKITTISGVIRSGLGLFGYASNATITNVKILNGSGTIGATTGSSYYVGSVVGYAANTTVTNCTNYEEVIALNDQAGGIVGEIAGGKISGCYNYGNVSGGLYVGGIIGQTSGTTTITNCYVKANTTARSNYNSWGGCNGGIVGYAPSGTLTITSCAFEGSLLYSESGSQTRQGSMLGYTNGATTKITDCYANATVNVTVSTSNVYGLCTGTATVTDCVFVTNSTKRCKGTSFTNWLITSDSRPVPAGLTWLATGGTKVTSSSQITALGYTLVS